MQLAAADLSEEQRRRLLDLEDEPGLSNRAGLLKGDPQYSLPEFLDFTLFGKTILVVVNRKFELFVAHPLRK